MKNFMIIVLIAIAIVAVCPVYGKVNAVKTNVVITEALNLSNKSTKTPFEQEYEFTDTLLVIESTYTPAGTTKNFKVTIGTKVAVEKKEGCVDSTNIQITKGNHVLKVETGDPKDLWTLKISEKKIIKTTTSKNISKKTNKKPKKQWPVIDTTTVKGKKVTTIERQKSYEYRTMRADPFLWESLQHELSLTDWPQTVQDSICARYTRYIAGNQKKTDHVRLRKVENGEVLDWMFSGGIKSNTRTLDKGRIVVAITHYMDENWVKQETSNINAISITYSENGTGYEALNFITNICGKDQCKNWAGKTFKTDK